MQAIVFFYPEKHEGHSEPNHPERPERVEAIRYALEDAGIWDQYSFLPPLDVPDNVLHSIHHPDYLAQVEKASQNSQRLDMDTYITPHSWQLALNAAGGAIAVAAKVWQRDAKRGFALCRPPGHHATPNQAMGFCLINNIAAAAEYLIQMQGAKKISIIDIDLHHGNGTQDIFYQRGDVQFFSIHQSPLYPGTGHLQETGAGKGSGTTINLPFPPGSGDQARKTALNEIILPLLDQFQPEMLLISYGFDAHWRDPLGNQLASADNYGQLVAGFAEWADKHCDGKIALILEGGYDLVAAQASALAVTHALLGEAWEDTVGPAPQAESGNWQQIIDQTKQIWKV